MRNNFLRKVGMIVRLAKRGAWYGAWRFSAELLYGLTHRKCRQCGVLKGFSTSSRCNACQCHNLIEALREEPGECQDPFEVDGWLNFADHPPQRHLWLQLKAQTEFGITAGPFIGRPLDLSDSMLAACDLYWRLTGIAKEQLEEKKRHRLAMELAELNRGRVRA
jgi:hypothetical protein